MRIYNLMHRCPVSLFILARKDLGLSSLLRRVLFSLTLFIWLVIPAWAEVQLAGVFGDHMVLQRDVEFPVWGWAASGSEITVQFAGQSRSATAGSDGRWSVQFAATSAGGPHNLTVSGDGELSVTDVWVGEVWLCSGQSNMAMTVSRARDYAAEQAKADLPMIRHFKTSAHATPEPQKDCHGEWTLCTAETVGSFTATGFFFGRKLHEELGVPVGLVNSSWGGTDIAAWTSLNAQQAQPAIVPKLAAYDAAIDAFDLQAANQTYQESLAKWEKRRDAAVAAGKPIPRKPQPPADPRFNQNRPANLFNGMIHPLIPFAIRGAIWYQGERNSHSVEDGLLYETQLKTLITDWRSRWGQGDFAFGTVQLPNFHAPTEAIAESTGWVLVRESELKSLDLPNTGIAVTIDVGEANDIHPKDKQTVGSRLALWALGTVYRMPIAYSGPLLAGKQIIAGSLDADGNISRSGRILLDFQHADGLKASDEDRIRGFAIAGEDRVFHPATASVQKQSGKLIVRSPKVLKPAAVRYNWADNPDGNLINASGLPASPFRTDDWEQ